MVPQQRQSRSRGRQRRAHDAIQGRTSVSCPNCGGVKLPHAACSDCGYVRPGLKLESAKQED